MLPLCLILLFVLQDVLLAVCRGEYSAQLRDEIPWVQIITVAVSVVYDAYKAHAAYAKAGYCPLPLRLQYTWRFFQATRQRLVLDGAIVRLVGQRADDVELVLCAQGITPWPGCVLNEQGRAELMVLLSFLLEEKKELDVRQLLEQMVSAEAVDRIHAAARVIHQQIRPMGEGPGGVTP